MPASSSIDTKNASSDIEKNKTNAMLAYILFFLPLLTAPESKFARYHANQGLVLWICVLGLSFLMGMLGLNLLAFFAYLVGLFIGVSNVSNGKMKPLPIIGSIKLIQ